MFDLSRKIPGENLLLRQDMLLSWSRITFSFIRSRKVKRTCPSTRSANFLDVASLRMLPRALKSFFFCEMSVVIDSTYNPHF